LVEKVAKYIPWKIVAAGDSGTLQYAKTNVCMLGKISSQSVKLWLRDASIYVLPVKYEPFGLSILEAAASGCALVLGNIDSAREIWDDAALYVDTDNPEQLKKTILTLIEDSDLLTEYSKKAKIRSNLFPIEKTALDYLNLYNSLSLQENKGDNI
jgi:glycosyltransferase involved in cell wall biosynthesis